MLKWADENICATLLTYSGLDSGCGGEKWCDCDGCGLRGLTNPACGCRTEEGEGEEEVEEEPVLPPPEVEQLESGLR